jgi:DnaJ-class molecular chaperone
MTSEPLKPGDEAAAGTPGTGENLCRKCGGTGLVDGRMCPVCDGTGRVTEGLAGG